MTGERVPLLDHAAARGMWRDVFAKAARAAAREASDRLDRHVYNYHTRPSALVCVFDGGGAVITTGIKVEIAIPRAYQITGWTLYAPTSGTFQVDLRKGLDFDAYETGPSSICADAKPLLDGLVKNNSELLPMTGWDTTLAPGNILRVVVELAMTVTLVTLTLRLRPV